MRSPRRARVEDDEIGALAGGERAKAIELEQSCTCRRGRDYRLHGCHACRDHQLQLVVLAIAVKRVLDAGVVTQSDGDAGGVETREAALLLLIRRDGCRPGRAARASRIHVGDLSDRRG